MKIDVTKTILNFNGTPAKTLNDKGEQKDLTLRDVVVDAVSAQFKDEQPSGTEKTKRFKIALDVYTNDVVEFNTETLATVKDTVAKAYGPLIVGRVDELLNGGAWVQELKSV